MSHFSQNYQQPPVDYESNKELKKLQFYGAGPKAALPDLSAEGKIQTYVLVKLQNHEPLDSKAAFSVHHKVKGPRFGKPISSATRFVVSAI